VRISWLRHPAWVAVASVLLLGGCLGRSPSVRFYTLRALPGTQTHTLGPDVGIQVGPVRVPRYLDQPQIVTRGEGSRIEIDEFNRWAGGLEANLLRALGDDLAARLPGTQVVVYPVLLELPVRYKVIFEITDLEGRPGGSLDLRVRWAIHSGVKDAVVAVESSRIQRSVSSGVDGLVEAHEQALAELADAIAARIAQLHAAAADPEKP
jgi:uncharacterized lipoprotein YmbA